jgi:hypothetical protein
MASHGSAKKVREEKVLPISKNLQPIRHTGMEGSRLTGSFAIGTAGIRDTGKYEAPAILGRWAPAFFAGTTLLDLAEFSYPSGNSLRRLSRRKADRKSMPATRLACICKQRSRTGTAQMMGTLTHHSRPSHPGEPPATLMESWPIAAASIGTFGTDRDSSIR